MSNELTYIWTSKTKNLRVKDQTMAEKYVFFITNMSYVFVILTNMSYIFCDILNLTDMIYILKDSLYLTLECL